MLRRLPLGLLVPFLLVGTAHAAPCPAYTYTLTNGTTADANAVMANFNSILNCANNNLAPISSPYFTGYLSVSGSSTGSIADFSSSAASGNWSYLAVHQGSYVATYGIDPQGNTDLYASTGQGLGLWTNTQIRAFITSSGNFGVGFNAASPPNLIFEVNGTAGGTSSWQTVSDARLKTNVTPISDALSLVQRLRGVRFQWRAADEREIGEKLRLPQNQTQIGFIAQEVEAVVPEAVIAPKKGSSGLYGLKEADLIPVLVEAIKEQQAEIDQLRTTVAALKAAVPAAH